jgi:tRNA/rRNA methyltransferase
MNLSHITIVLDQVRHPDNLGSALRAMKNTGLSRISLCAAQTRDFDRARVLATDAIDLLPRMRLFETLPQAVAHGTLIAGMTSRQLGHRPTMWLDQFVELADRETASGGEVVIVFGNERRGLSNAELDVCHLAVNIPTAPEKSSINLAQSVMLVAHALFSKSHREQQERYCPSEVPVSLEALCAPAGLVQALYDRAFPLLLEADFLNPQSPGLIFAELKRLLERARPTKREVELLLSALKHLERKKRR